MGWLIAWLILAVLLSNVPSSERINGQDIWKAGALSFGFSAIVVLIAFGLWSAYQGIF